MAQELLSPQPWFLMGRYMEEVIREGELRGEGEGGRGEGGEHSSPQPWGDIMEEVIREGEGGERERGEGGAFICGP